MCNHQPPCPSARAPERAHAHRSSVHTDQGWALLCNGVVVFEDGGLLLPDGEAIPAPRPRHCLERIAA